jgi:hypothetical protein
VLKEEKTMSKKSRRKTNTISLEREIELIKRQDRSMQRQGYSYYQRASVHNTVERQMRLKYPEMAEIQRLAYQKSGVQDKKRITEDLQKRFPDMPEAEKIQLVGSALGRVF